MLLLLITWSPVCEVRLNNEVVMFQPWTGNSLDLVSVGIINLFSIHSDPIRLASRH